MKTLFKQLLPDLQEETALGAGPTEDGTEVLVDISGLIPGSEATLVLRLVNPDGDTDTSVRILCEEESCESVVADEEVILDLATVASTGAPTYYGDPDLLPYFSYDVTGPARMAGRPPKS